MKLLATADATFLQIILNLEVSSVKNKAATVGLRKRRNCVYRPKIEGFIFVDRNFKIEYDLQKSYI